MDESTNEITQLDCFDSKKVIRYLGSPLGKGKISKMKWCERQLLKMKSKAQILVESEEIFDQLKGLLPDGFGG
jgi:hypothetical protein